MQIVKLLRPVLFRGQRLSESRSALVLRRKTRLFSTENGTTQGKQVAQTVSRADSGSSSKRSMSVFLVAAGGTALVPILGLDWAHRNPDTVLDMGLPEVITETLLCEPAVKKLKKGRVMLGLNPDVYSQTCTLDEAPCNKPWYEVSHLRPQRAILTDVRENALFMTIHLKDDSDTDSLCSAAALVARALSDIEKDGLYDCEIAIGFSQDIWEVFQPDVPAGASTQTFRYKERKGRYGNLPATGGDIFLHCKGSNVSDCYEVCRMIVDKLPKDSVQNCEQVIGFQYQNKQMQKTKKPEKKETYDLCGAKINVANPVSESERARQALIPTTGGSYVLVQQWSHDLEFLQLLSREQREKLFGKNIDDTYLGDIDLKQHPEKLQEGIASGLPKESHVARVIGLNPDCSKLEIVRQSLSYGQVLPVQQQQESLLDRFLHGVQTVHPSDTSGLFFVAYSKDPVTFWYMLDRMTGNPIRGENNNKGFYISNDKNDGANDSIMRFSQCIRGQCYYVPSVQQISAIAKFDV